MKLQINGQHVEITDPMREHIISRLKSLDPYLHKEVAVHVMVKMEKHRHVIEISVAAAHTVFFATAHSGDMYIATDRVVDKLGRQLTKHKEKRTSHHEDEVLHHEPITRSKGR